MAGSVQVADFWQDTWLAEPKGNTAHDSVYSAARHTED